MCSHDQPTKQSQPGKLPGSAGWETWRNVTWWGERVCIEGTNQPLIHHALHPGVDHTPEAICCSTFIPSHFLSFETLGLNVIRNLNRASRRVWYSIRIELNRKREQHGRPSKLDYVKKSTKMGFALCWNLVPYQVRPSPPVPFLTSWRI